MHRQWLSTIVGLAKSKLLMKDATEDAINTLGRRGGGSLRH